jgi:serine/threonine-protein kinase RCK2
MRERRKGPELTRYSHPQRANILKEVQIMRQIDHPNIVQLIDFSESRQYYYLVLELCPGGELFHQIVRLTYFSEDLSRHVIVQVAQALEYLHEVGGVVHRYVGRWVDRSGMLTG